METWRLYFFILEFNWRQQQAVLSHLEIWRVFGEVGAYHCTNQAPCVQLRVHLLRFSLISLLNCIYCTPSAHLPLYCNTPLSPLPSTLVFAYSSQLPPSHPAAPAEHLKEPLAYMRKAQVSLSALICVTPRSLPRLPPLTFCLPNSETRAPPPSPSAFILSLKSISNEIMVAKSVFFFFA